MDVQIANGLVYDGSGAPPIRADVWLDGERIAHVGPLEGAAADSMLDARGKIVCPGFVDIHRHCDVKPFTDPRFGEAELLQGITTVVAGNCGFSPAPLNPRYERETLDYLEPILGRPYPFAAYSEYLDALDGARLPVHFASMIGTGSVKIAVKGFGDAPFSPDEVLRARELIARALREGAAGVSLGIMYIPECYTSTDEYAGLLRPAGEAGAVAAVHIRGEGDSMVRSVAEALEIGRRAGCAIEISHFKSVGMANWRRDIHRAIALIEEARARGQDASCDFYPYDGGSTTLCTMLPPAFVRGDMPGALRRLGTPEGVEDFRRCVGMSYGDWDNLAVSLGWERILISSVAKERNRRYLGKTVAEAAEQFGFADAAALAAHLLFDEDGKVAIINRSMCGDDIDAVARLPYSTVISDAIYAETDTPHPRLYGAFPKFLREYAGRVVPMEEAIRKMTSQPAARMRLPRRGLLREGYCADVNVFDPAVFRDNATYTDSARPATGLDACFVGGKIAVEHGRRTSVFGGEHVRIR